MISLDQAGLRLAKVSDFNIFIRLASSLILEMPSCCVDGEYERSVNETESRTEMSGEM